MTLVDKMVAEVGPVDVKKAEPRRTNGTNGQSPFALVNAIPIENVLTLLSVEHDGRNVHCPHCGNGYPSDSSCSIMHDGNGVKCLHDTCSGAGPTGKPGFRTCVDMVALVKSISEIEAVKWLAENFNIDLPSRKTDTNNADGAAQPLWDTNEPVEPKGDFAKQQTEKQAAKKPRTFKDVIAKWRKEGELERIDTGIATRWTNCVVVAYSFRGALCSSVRQVRRQDLRRNRPSQTGS